MRLKTSTASPVLTNIPMNKYRSFPLLTAALALAAFSSFACTEKAGATEASASSANPGVNQTAKSAAPETMTPVSTDVVSVQWIDLKDYTYDQRVPMFAGLKQLEAKVDQQVSELTAKRAAMNSTANTKDWDFAMKEMENARSYLKSTSDELTKATPETWNQIKDKVGLAWVRAQEAYAKVKSSTTS